VSDFADVGKFPSQADRRDVIRRFDRTDDGGRIP